MLGWREFLRDSGHGGGGWAYGTGQGTDEWALEPSWGKACVIMVVSVYLSLVSGGEAGVPDLMIPIITSAGSNSQLLAIWSGSLHSDHKE